MDIWLTHGLAALAGFAIGAGGVALLGQNRTKGRKVRELEKEFEAYKAKVASHFASTANLVDDLTDRYQSVFEQLQSGADELLDEETLRTLLSGRDQNSITLHRLGWKPGFAVSDENLESDEDGDQFTESVAEPSETENEESPPAAESEGIDAGEQQSESTEPQKTGTV